MFRTIIGALVALTLTTQTSFAQHGHGGGHGGGQAGGHGGNGVYYHGGSHVGGHGGNGVYYSGSRASYGYPSYSGYGYGSPLLGGYGLGGYGLGGYGLGGSSLGGYGLLSRLGLGYGLGGYGLGGYGGSYYGSGIPYSSSGVYTDPYSSGYYNPVPAPYPDTTVAPNPAPSSQPVPLNSGSTQAGTATLTVIAVAGMQVWFNDTPAEAGGTKWAYTTPVLEPGKTVIVNVKARWVDGGQNKSVEVPVRLVAGDNRTVDLTHYR